MRLRRKDLNKFTKQPFEAIAHGATGEFQNRGLRANNAFQFGNHLDNGLRVVSNCFEDVGFPVGQVRVGLAEQLPH